MPHEKYKHLMSPLRIRGKTLKSRFMFPVAQAHFLQGPELYPADPVTAYYASFARQGNALIITHELTNPSQRKQSFGDGPHFAVYDMDDPACQNYFTQFTSIIHFYGSLVGVNLNYDGRSNYSVNDPALAVREPGLPDGKDSVPMHRGDDDDEPPMMGPGHEQTPKEYFTKEKIREYISFVCDKAKKYKSFGYDAVHVEMSNEYFVGQFLNPKFNKRTDEYGGSFENRARFAVELVSSLREAIGEDMIITCNGPAIGDYFNKEGSTPMPGFSGEEMNNTLTVEEAVAFMDMLSPWLDVYRVQGSVYRNEPATKAGPITAKQLKDAGAKCLIAVNNPAMDLELLDSFIAEGTADIIVAGRLFMCNDKLDEILENGNEYDMNHCIGCSVCRGVSQEKDWRSYCAINPRLGIDHRIDNYITPPGSPRRVAIIGGGPGGMKCALWLQERGHTPIIFEKEQELGGLIKFVRYLPHKEMYTEYLDALINQVNVHGIEVRLNTEANTEMIKEEGFDVVIAATGSRAKKSTIPGAKQYGSKWNTVNVYGNEEKIGKRVVVIGGSSGPCEAAMYLDAHGHDVTLISRNQKLFHDVAWHHVMQSNMDLDRTGVKKIKRATTVRIEDGKVIYVKKGEEHSLEFDDIVVAAGLESNWETAQSFYGSAKQYFEIGDCREAGDMRTAIADAFNVAMRI